MPKHQPDRAPAGETLVERRRRTATPRRYRVLLHNDDYTTMDFVVDILRRLFQKPTAEAIRIMLEVHYRGIGLAGVYPREVAETKIAQVTAEAGAQGMPLLATAEPDSPDDAGG